MSKVISSIVPPSVLSTAQVLTEMGGGVVLFPPQTSPKDVRDCQTFLKKALREHSSNLQKVGKVLEIHKFRERGGERRRGLSITIAIEAKQNPSKLILPMDDGIKPQKMTYTNEIITKARERGVKL